MDLDFEFDCPTCGRSIKATVAELARGATKRCPSGHSVTMEDDGGGARKAQKAVDDLERAIKRFGK